MKLFQKHFFKKVYQFENKTKKEKKINSKDFFTQ